MYICIYKYERESQEKYKGQKKGPDAFAHEFCEYGSLLT